MNVLLVDDDRFVVAALEKKINWSSLSITGVFTAANIRQAQKIISENSISICVCDIEMPGGSGLDLLMWVREQKLETQFIFLTSYADFSYAQQAISLSSLDYQLKPINFDKLEQILRKAIDKAQSTAELAATKLNGKLWENNYQNIINMFWKNLFSRTLLRDPVFLEQELKNKALHYHSSDTFIPVLFHLYPGRSFPEDMEPSIVDFSFSNITGETLHEACILYESIITLTPQEYILLIGNVCLDEVRQPLTTCFEKVFSNVGNFLNCDISCCVSPEFPMTELPDALRQLRKMLE